MARADRGGRRRRRLRAPRGRRRPDRPRPARPRAGPGHGARRGRRPHQLHAHRARRHHDQAQRAGHAAGRRHPGGPDRPPAPARRRRALGGALRLPAAGHPGGLVRRRSSPRCATPAPASPSTRPRRPLLALLAAGPDRGARPAQAQHRGARPAGRGVRGRDPRRPRGDPGGGAHAARPRRRRGAAHPGRRRRAAVHADGGLWSALPPPITVRSTVGAGDCSLAGYLLAALAGALPAERLRTAVAYGSAAASMPGSALPTPAQVDVSAVRVTAGMPDRIRRPPPLSPSRPPAGTPAEALRRGPMTALITTDLVALDADLGADKGAVVRRLAELVAAAGRATGADALHGDAMAREAQAPTGLPGGIAIPHCRSAAVTEASLAFARLVPEGRLRRARRAGRPRLPDRGARARRRRPPHAAHRAGPRARPAGVRRIAARGGLGRGDRPAGATRSSPRARTPATGPRRDGRPPPAAATAPAARPPPGAASWSSAPARPGSRTPTWPPTSSSPRAGPPASTSTSRPRAPPAPPRSTRPSSAPPTPSSSPSTSACGTRTASPASRSCRAARSGPSTSPT